MSTHDIETRSSGGGVEFTMLSPAAHAWAAEKLTGKEWPWTGPTLWVDRRLAPFLTHLAFEAGLEVRSYDLRAAQRGF